MGIIQIIAPDPVCSVLEIAQTEVQATGIPDSFVTPHTTGRLRLAFVAWLLLPKTSFSGVGPSLWIVQDLKFATKHLTSCSKYETLFPAWQDI